MVERLLGTAEGSVRLLDEDEVERLEAMKEDEDEEKEDDGDHLRK